MLKIIRKFSIKILNGSYTLICSKILWNKRLTSKSKKTKFDAELTKIKGKAFII